jgi:hypothetical protein
VICLIESDQGLELSEVFWDSWTHRVDCLAHKLELTSGLVGDGSTVNRHDRFFLGDGGGLSP